MSGIIDNIRKFFLLRRKNQISKDLAKLSKKTFADKTSKTIIGNGAKVSINAKKKQLIEEVKANISAIVQSTKCNQEALLNYVKAAKTPIYRIDAPNRLALIGEEEGFICEQQGFNALFISILTGQGIKFKTEPAFVIRKTNDINKSWLLHNFYRWYSMKAGLEGFDYNSRKKMKIYMSDNSLETTRKLSLETVNQIQEAISREREANTFVLEYEKQIEGSKKVLNKIKDEGGADI